MIAVLSDIHGNLEAFNAVIEDIYKGGDPTMILILGDLVDYGADSVSVVESIKDLSNKSLVVCIRGNHDESIICKDSTRFRTSHGRQNFLITLEEMTKSSVKDLDNICKYCGIHRDKYGTVDAYHATPADPYWGKTPKVYAVNTGTVITRFSDSQRVLFGGHSHIQGWAPSPDTLYINPGSVGQPRNGDPRAQYLVCDDKFTTFEFKRVEYDIETAARKIEKSGRPKFLATRLYLGI